MEIIALGFLVGMVTALVFIGVGVLWNDRTDKGKYDADCDIRLYVPSRNRDRRGNHGHHQQMDAEEVVNGLQNIRMSLSRTEKAWLDYACDCVLQINKATNGNGRENDEMAINNLQYNKMLEEYRKDGKFSEYVKKCMHTYGTTLRDELHKTITWEYFKSVVDGCNKES